MKIAPSSAADGPPLTPSAGEKVPNVLVVVVLLAVQIIFSGWHVVGKAVLEAGTNPVAFALWREVCSALVIFTVAVLRDGRAHSWVPERRHVRDLLLIGFLTFFSVVGFIVALRWVSPFNAAVLQPSIPVFTSAIAVTSGLERARTSNTLGVALSVAGAVLVAWATEHGHKAGGIDNARLQLLGNAVLLAQCIFSAWNCVLIKRVVRHYRATWTTAWYYSIGAAFTAALALSLYTGDPNVRLLPPPVAHAHGLWAALAYATCAVTAFNYQALTWAIKHAPASQVALYSTLQPVFTALMAYVTLGSPISVGQAAGGVFVCLGLCTNTLGATSNASEGHRSDIAEASVGGEGGGDDVKDNESASMLRS